MRLAERLKQGGKDGGEVGRHNRHMLLCVHILQIRGRLAYPSRNCVSILLNVVFEVILFFHLGIAGL